MKAVVRKGLKRGELELCDLKIPEPRKGQALVRIKAVGVCGTDIHIYKGEAVTKIPIVVGHEFSGVIEKVETNIAKLNKGDRVVSRLNIRTCGRCKACLSGNPHMCEYRQCPGFQLDGAYAEYIAIDSTQLIKIEDNITFDEAALVEPMAIVITALLERKKIEAEDVVVIFGPGPIGLISLQIAKIYGASKVIVVGINEDEYLRLPLAKKMGADIVLNATRDKITENILEITKGEKADLVIEASGAVSAINQGIQVLRHLGRMCILGLPTREIINVEWLRAAQSSLNLDFSYSSAPLAWNKAVSILDRKILNIKSMITHKEKLENFHKIFKEAEEGRVIKAVLLP